MLVRNQMESSRTNTNLIERTGRGVMADALRYGCIANIASAWLVLDHPFPRDLSCASPYGRTAHQVRTSVPVWTPYCPGVWIGTLSVRPPSCCRPDRTLLETAVDGRDRLVQMPFFEDRTDRRSSRPARLAASPSSRRPALPVAPSTRRDE